MASGFHKHSKDILSDETPNGRPPPQDFQDVQLSLPISLCSTVRPRFSVASMRDYSASVPVQHRLGATEACFDHLNTYFIFGALLLSMPAPGMSSSQ
jgi:hypothetical protein